MKAHRSKKAFEFIHMIQRSKKPRKRGLVMVLDKGYGPLQARDLMPAADYIDIIKLGWATPRLFSEETIRGKIDIYNSSNIMVGNGGTFLEIAFQQNKVDQFLHYCRETGFKAIEVSNGIINIPAEVKAEIIRKACDQGFFVVSEVGKKDPSEDRKLSLQERISEAKRDLAAGARFVIIEAREGGKSLGVYDETGALKEEMARFLAGEIGLDNIMFEAPEKTQQTQLILLFGSDINLGNIRPEDVIPLETLRRGIRGDTCGKIQDSNGRRHSAARRK